MNVDLERMMKELPANGPLPRHPPALKEGGVEVFSEQGCTGARLFIRGLSAEKECARCWSVCEKKFEDGSPLHSTAGSQIQSMRVVGGVDVRAYVNCMGFGWGADQKDKNYIRMYTAEDGCVDASAARWEHYTFAANGEEEFTGLTLVDGQHQLPPTTRPHPPEMRPQLPGDAPQEAGSDEYPFFDMSRSADERAEALAEEVKRVRQSGSPGGQARLGLLYMLSRRWEQAVAALRRAVGEDPQNRRLNTLLGTALDGYRCSGGPVRAEEVRAAFHSAWESGMSEYGSDVDVLDVHFGGRGRAFGRHGGGDSVFQRAGAEVVADASAYWELYRLDGRKVPQLMSLPSSRGDHLWNVASTLNESVTRFHTADVVLLKNVLPQFVAFAVRDFYRRFWGQCHSDGVGLPVRCDAPERQVWGRNANDPQVHNAHSDRVGFFLNQYLRPLVEAFSARSLTPVYSYYVRYLDKPDGLQPHTDMVDNEYTMSMQLDYTPEERGPCELFVWKKRLPFQEQARNLEQMCPNAHGSEPHCESPGDSIGGVMQIGDAVLFRGRQHIHWRPRWKMGRTCAAVLAHFVVRENVLHRTAHNRMVCCAWPPLPEYNHESCHCPDTRLRYIQEQLKKHIPI